jgi:integrase
MKPLFGPPKSRAGRRVVGFADLVVPDLRKHLRVVPAGALAFTSPEGMAVSNTNFRRRIWGPALAAVGLEGTHIHDLRHTGSQFTANAGALGPNWHSPRRTRSRAVLARGWHAVRMTRNA